MCAFCRPRTYKYPGKNNVTFQCLQNIQIISCTNIFLWQHSGMWERISIANNKCGKKHFFLFVWKTKIKVFQPICQENSKIDRVRCSFVYNEELFDFFVVVKVLLLVRDKVANKLPICWDIFLLFLSFKPFLFSILPNWISLPGYPFQFTTYCNKPKVILIWVNKNW